MNTPAWGIEYGFDQVTVRHLRTDEWVVFYPDRDPLMVAFLHALGKRGVVREDIDAFLAGPEEETP